MPNNRKCYIGDFDSIDNSNFLNRKIGISNIRNRRLGRIGFDKKSLVFNSGIESGKDYNKLPTFNTTYIPTVVATWGITFTASGEGGFLVPDLIYPSGIQQGDVIILIASNLGGVNPGSSWNFMESQLIGDFNISIFNRIAIGTESNTIAIPESINSFISLQLIIFRNGTPVIEDFRCGDSSIGYNPLCIVESPEKANVHVVGYVFETREGSPLPTDPPLMIPFDGNSISAQSLINNAFYYQLNDKIQIFSADTILVASSYASVFFPVDPNVYSLEYGQIYFVYNTVFSLY